MILSKAAIYFDEVARRGSIRSASERLNIAASAIDRQILQLERFFGVRLYERLPSGIRLTAAGEMAVHAIRESKRELENLQHQLDELQGLRRGEVKIAAAEGAMSVLGTAVCAMRAAYPGIVTRMKIMGAAAVVEAVEAGDVDLGLTFNAPSLRMVRVEASIGFRMGVVVPPDHPMAARPSVSLNECAKLPLIVPNDSLSLRQVLDQAWARTVGGHPHPAAEANSIAMLKSLVRGGAGVGMLTAIDAVDEVARGELIFVPLANKEIVPSTLAIISDQRRILQGPATVLLSHLQETLSTVAGA